MFGMQVCDARTSAGNGVAVESNIQKYQAFLQTVRLGSITRAARSLDYSQSGVSRMVADLERAWGVSLLERGHGGVRLTAEGERLLPFVEEVCEGARRLSMQVDDINGFETGTVRIGTFSSVATHWLPRIIKRFQRDFPNIEYEMLLGVFPEIERWCEEGRVDLGFLPYAPAPASLGARWLEDDELLAVLPEGHELATTSAPVPLARLCEEPFIMLEQSGDEEVRSVFARAGLTPRVRFTTFDDYAIMSMVESGLGLAVLPALILRRNPYHVAVRQLDPVAHRSINVVYRDLDRLPLAAKRFLGYLDYRSG